MKMIGHKGYVKVDYAPPMASQKLVAIPDQDEVPLPPEYHQFETYLPRNGEYDKLNIP
jgi:hypothetical protein